MDEAFTTLNNVNSSSKPYKSKYTKKTVSKKVLAGYKADGNAVYIDSTEVKSYNLSEILDGKASPIQAAKAVYDDRIKAVKEMMAKKDQLSDEQIKAIEGKSAEEVVAVRYPGQLPDYQRLKASRYYEENKESLQYLDIGLKTLAVLSMIGGAALAPATGGTSLTATYAGGTYLAADSAYSAIEGHSFITGTQLTTEERIWAGIDSVVTIASMGSAAYLAKLAKSGAEGSTLLKNLATAGTHADDVNDFTKVAYAVGTGKDPSSDIQSLMFGQIMGFGMKQAGNYLGKKFGAPSVDVSGTKPSQLDVPLQTKQIPNLDPANVRLDSRPDLHLKASPADGTLAKLKNHPAVSMDVPKVKQVSGDSAIKAIGGIKPSDVDVPKVKGTTNPSPSQSTTSPIKDMPLEEYELYRTKSVINPDSDTMTLGKYEPTIRPDGTQDWSTPGPNSYISKAGDTTYFSLGDDWNKITVEYGLDAEGRDMFKYFNQPALDDAVAQGKTIRFSHNPTLKMYEKSAIRWEWDYLKEHHGYNGLKPKGGYWYGIK